MIYQRLSQKTWMTWLTEVNKIVVGKCGLAPVDKTDGYPYCVAGLYPLTAARTIIKARLTTRRKA